MTTPHAAAPTSPLSDREWAEREPDGKALLEETPWPHQHLDHAFLLSKLRAARTTPCPYIQSSEEGTAYCTLAEGRTSREGETPVAWGVQYSGYFNNNLFQSRAEAERFKDDMDRKYANTEGLRLVTPLYAHSSPPPATEKARAYIANFGEQARGIESVVLPLGDPKAIERLARDVEAFGYGMGEAPPESEQQLEWMQKATDARVALMENVHALAKRSGLSSPHAVVGDSQEDHRE